MTMYPHAQCMREMPPQYKGGQPSRCPNMAQWNSLGNGIKVCDQHLPNNPRLLPEYIRLNHPIEQAAEVYCDTQEQWYRWSTFGIKAATHCPGCGQTLAIN